MIDIKESAKIKNTLAKNGGEWVDLPLLLPSSTVLELAGEGLRPRIYFANSPDGEEFCLRADLTMPAAITFVASGDDSAIYLCSGKVFRAQKDNSISPEFRQIGIERYGDKNKDAADIATFTSIYETCQTIGLDSGKLILSDGGLAKAILKNADISDVWRDYFLQQINNIDELKRRIKIAIKTDNAEPSAIEKSLLAINDDKIGSELVEDILNISNLKPGLARGTFDIAHRMRLKAQRLTAKPFDKTIAEKIVAIFSVKGEPTKAINEIAAMAGEIGIDLLDWTQIWQEKITKINKLTDKSLEVVFDAGLEKRFEYYDGIIFEIYAKGHEKYLASGGRYDGLIAELSKGAKDVPAVGAVIRPEIILNASEFAGDVL